MDVGGRGFGNAKEEGKERGRKGEPQMNRCPASRSKLRHSFSPPLFPHPPSLLLPVQVVSESISYQPHYRTLTDAGK